MAGEVLITHHWLSGCLVGEGQDGAGCTQAQGHHIPLFVLPFFAPSCPCQSCGNQPRICHCHPCPQPSASNYYQLCLLYLISLFSVLSFHFCCSGSSRSNNRGNICQSLSCQFICVGRFQSRRSASENLTTSFVHYLSVCFRGKRVLLLCACDSDKDVCDPAAEMTLVLPTRG